MFQKVNSFSVLLALLFVSCRTGENGLSKNAGRSYADHRITVTLTGPCEIADSNLFALKEIRREDGQSLVISSSIQPANSGTMMNMWSFFSQNFFNSQNPAAKHVLSGMFNEKGNFIGGHHWDTLINLKEQIPSMNLTVSKGGQLRTIDRVDFKIKNSPVDAWNEAPRDIEELRRLTDANQPWRVRMEFFAGPDRVAKKDSTLFLPDWGIANITHAANDALSAPPTHLRINDNGEITLGVFATWQKNPDNTATAFLTKSSPDEVEFFAAIDEPLAGFYELPKIGGERLFADKWTEYLENVIKNYADNVDDKHIVQNQELLASALQESKRKFHEAILNGKLSEESYLEYVQRLVK